MYPSRRLRESWLIVGVEAADDRLMRNGLGINGNHFGHNQSGTTMSTRDQEVLPTLGHATGACVIGEGCRQGYPIA